MYRSRITKEMLSVRLIVPSNSVLINSPSMLMDWATAKIKGRKTENLNGVPNLVPLKNQNRR